MYSVEIGAARGISRSCACVRVYCTSFLRLRAFVARSILEPENEATATACTVFYGGSGGTLSQENLDRVRVLLRP